MTKEHHAPIICNVLFCPWDYLGKNTGAGLSFPPPRDLPYPGNQSRSLASPALAGGFFTTRAPREVHTIILI